MKSIFKQLIITKFNDEQLKHSANTFRLMAFAVLGAIGWPAYNENRWFEVFFTAVAVVVFEYIALLYLGEIEK